MNSLFPLDDYDEGYRRMLRNHCSTLHQESAYANVLADSFDFGGGVGSLKLYAHRAFQVEATVFSLMPIAQHLCPTPNRYLPKMRRILHKRTLLFTEACLVKSP